MAECTSWKQFRDFTPEEWNSLLAHVEILLKIANRLPEFRTPKISDNEAGHKAWFDNCKLEIGDPSALRSWSTGPVLTDKIIAFNGKGDVPIGHPDLKYPGKHWTLAGEAFILSREGTGSSKTDSDNSFAICTHDRRPYALLVAATLLIADKIAPKVLIVEEEGWPVVMRDTKEDPLWRLASKLANLAHEKIKNTELEGPVL